MNKDHSDKLDAEVVEILLDEHGKLWVNVDGVCTTRIGKVQLPERSRFTTVTLENLSAIDQLTGRPKDKP